MKKMLQLMELVQVSVTVACGVENQDSEVASEYSSSAFERDEGFLLQNLATDSRELLSSAEGTHTWEQEGVVGPIAAQVKILATCSGSALIPWYSNGRTYARGKVSCSSNATIPATLYLQRYDGSYVGSYNATLTGTSMTWTFSASGCNSATYYRTRFSSNGVLHISGWKRGCT